VIGAGSFLPWDALGQDSKTDTPLVMIAKIYLCRVRARVCLVRWTVCSVLLSFLGTTVQFTQAQEILAGTEADQQIGAYAVQKGVADPNGSKAAPVAATVPAARTTAGPRGEAPTGAISGRVQNEVTGTVKLDPFVISSSKLTDGEALATNEQRFAANIKNVVATDAFGDVTEGNIVEFLKFLPGVTVGYEDGNLSPITASVRGFDPNLTKFNASDAHVSEAELSVRQSLGFAPLPSWARPFQVFANTTKLRLEGNQNASFIAFMPFSLNWGVTFSRNPLTLMANWSHLGRQRTTAVAAMGPDAFIYIEPRTTLNLNCTYQLGKRVSPFGSGRNVQNTPRNQSRAGSETPEYARRHQPGYYGVQYSVGV
jgi:hypothetical protein